MEIHSEKRVLKVAVLVFWFLIYMEERKEMGQAALETALNDQEHEFLWPFFFAVRVIFDIGGLSRIFVYRSYEGNPNWFPKTTR